MLPNRFRISKQATDSLRLVKSKTGVTPNILCRMALVLSLRDGAMGADSETDLDGSEFNTPTLFGEHALVYEGLVREVHGSVDAKAMQKIVAAHIEAGVEQLRRVRSVGDLLSFSKVDA